MSGSDPNAMQAEAEDEEAERETEDLVGTVVAERYRIEEKLGEGGMGAVYRAEHVLMKKPVAIKVLHREMTVMKEAVKRFEREAIAAGRIEHPNVALATDFGKLANGSFFLVLEYIPGRDLTDLIKAEGALPPERAMIIARQVASALAAAHAADIVHRDLKPDNVMLIERGGTQDFVKVLDFGIAKVNLEGGSQTLTRLGSVFGTPQYMPPEQAAGKPVDHRADLYALGLIMHEMLRGQPVFQSEELVGLLTKQMLEPPPPLPAATDPGLQNLVMRLLEKDPEQRVQTAGELVAELDALLGPLAPMPESGVMPPSGNRASVVDSTPEPPVADVARAATALGAAPASKTLANALRRAKTVLGEGPGLEAVKEVAAQPVRVGGRRLPLWTIGAGIASLLLVVIVLASGSDLPEPAQPAASAAAGQEEAEPPEPDMQRILSRAAGGDREALDELGSIPAKERTGEQWVALGKGRAKLRNFKGALEAFDRGLELEPSLVQDRAIVLAVRQAAARDDTEDLALRVAAERLGDRGADILFDVWASTKRKTDATEAAKKLLDSRDVKKNASPALKVALDLRDAQTCAEYKKVLPAVIEHGDERSLRPLRPLLSRRGCGFLSLKDCYSCLRGNDDLKEALAAAQARKPPAY